MYTIKEAAARSGVTVPTLRAWERRYGVVHPVRTAAGYRLYDEAAIGRLRVMRRLVDDGWGASQAARRVIEMGDEAVGESLDRAAVPAPAGPSSSMTGRGLPGGEPGAADEAPNAARADFRSGLVAAAIALDAGRIDALLDDAFAVSSFERAMTEVVGPAMAAIGDAWERGELDIAGEHAASHAVVRRLGRLFDSAGRGDRPPQALLGLPPGAHHEIGLLAFGVAALRAGVPVLYLGANVPGASWALALDQSRAAAVVLGVPTLADREAARAVIDAIAGRPQPPALFLGGTGAAALDGYRGARLLPGDVAAAAVLLAEATQPPVLTRAGRRGSRTAGSA